MLVSHASHYPNNKGSGGGGERRGRYNALRHWETKATNRPSGTHACVITDEVFYILISSTEQSSIWNLEDFELKLDEFLNRPL